MRIFFTDARGNPIFGFRRRKAAVPIFASVVANASFNGSNHSSSNSHGGSSSPNTTTTKSPPPPPVAPIRSTLFFHILNRNWEWVVRRARTHPQEIHQYDSRTGDMPLHAACRLNPPVAAIRALLAVNHHHHNNATRRFSFSKPSSASKAEAAAQPAAELHYNSDGWNALHVAASNQCSRQVLEVLVEYAPHAVQQLTRKTKRTPIHCAAAASFRGLDRHAFFYLLNVSLQQQQQQQEQQQAMTVPEDEDLDQESADGNPAAANHHSKSLLCWKDSTGQTPLALLFRRYRERVKHVCQQMDQLRLSRNEALALVQTELGPLWDKARGMVERLSAVLSSSSSSLAMLPSEVDYPLVHEDIDLGTAVTGFGAVPNHQHHHHARHDPQQPLASLLKARSRSSLQGRRFRLVHASVGLIGFGCPPEMIRLAVSLYPHQAAEVDEDGNLPLLIAARRFQQEQQEAAAAAAAAAADVLSVGLDDLSLHTHLNGAQLQHSSPHGLHNSFGNNNNNNGDNWDTMSIFSEATTAASTIAGFSSKKSPWDQVFDMLLQQYPRAAGMPQQQSAAADMVGGETIPSSPPPQDTTLPLAVAMKSCNSFMSWRRDGLERLYHAHPPALHMVLEQQQEAQLKRDDDDVDSNSNSNNNNHGGRALYPHLLALLLAKDQQHLHVLRGGRRSIRMNANLRRRTPLDIARMSSVFWLLQTKPEMLESLPLSTSP